MLDEAGPHTRGWWLARAMMYRSASFRNPEDAEWLRENHARCIKMYESTKPGGKHG